MATKKSKYPLQIYVTHESNDNESYLLAHKDVKDTASVYSVEEIAIYQFVRVAKIKTDVVEI